MDKRHSRLSSQNWTKDDIVVYERVRRNGGIIGDTHERKSIRK